MAGRWFAALLVLASLGTAGCRSDEVALGFEPREGATYRYRYVVEATVTRRVEGGEPRTTEIDMTFESEQRVLEHTRAGAVMEVTLSSASSAPRTAVVLLDRAGSVQAIEQVDGLPAVDAGLPSPASLLASTATEPPARPLRLGDQWKVDDSTVTGEGTLDRFALVDGEEGAVVVADLVDALTGSQTVDGSEVVLDGDVRSTVSTTFDLLDGAVRDSVTQSDGEVQVEVAPPAGVEAPPVVAVVTYELRIRTTRTG
jgi:hypothetical protein